VAGDGYVDLNSGAGYYSGDGGAAINASLYDPVDVAVDAAGNLFIADSGNNVIRKVDVNGIITTVAGNGYVNPIALAGSYSGDGGSATNASLNYPDGVAVDASDNLFIADAGNNRIRKVAIASISTVTDSANVGLLFSVGFR
jgi:sugar lactone lactonase YvrE